jgi:hypothetical protein
MRLTQRVAIWRWLRAVAAPVLAICCGKLRLKGVAVSRANMRLDALGVRSVTDSADRMLVQWPAEPRFSLLVPIMGMNEEAGLCRNAS